MTQPKADVLQVHNIARGSKILGGNPSGPSVASLQHDGEVTFTASCAREGAARIGFGERRGCIVDWSDRNGALRARSQSRLERVG